MIGVVLLVLVLGLPSLGSAVCTGASPNWACSGDYASLNDLINGNNPGKVQDGDTITVTQTGSVTWSSRLDITNKSVSLIGPGRTSLTVICTGPTGCLLWTTKNTGSTPAGFTRLSGFKFTQSGGGCEMLKNGTSGSVNFSGTSPNVRIDNMHFADVECGTLHIFGYVRGVVDHTIFENVSAPSSHSTNIEHESWLGLGEYGDRSWATASTKGTADQLIFEDCQFINSNPGTTYAGIYATNDSVGARTTYRFNTWFNNTYQTHGTETNGRARGQRHTEFYRNDMTWNRFGVLGSNIAYRGGTMMTFDNRVTATSGWLERIVSFSTARRDLIGVDIFPWETCGRITITSITSSGSLATATYLGDYLHIHNTSGYLRIVGANESKYNGVVQPDRIENTNQFTYSVSSFGATKATGTIYAESPFDGNTDTTGYPCMDQAGRGKGILISGTVPNGMDGSYETPNPNPPQWAGNESEPNYVWNNRLNGALNAGYPSPRTSDVILDNRDYYNEAVKFTGMVGIGRGLRSARPATCTAGTAYWSTDGGGNWNTSTTETFSALVGYSAGADGGLDYCQSTNIWVNDWYIPYVYPHPLVGRR